MNRAACFLLTLALGGFVASARGGDVTPQAAAASRYARMADRSPFAPPTPVLPVAAPVAPPPRPKWSDQLTITGLTQEGGIYFATVVDKTQGDRFLLQTNKEDSERQLALANVEWGSLPEQTVVTLRHNSEFATVRFDANTSPTAPVASAPAPGRVTGFSAAALASLNNGQPRTFNTPAVPPPGTSGVVRRLAPIRANPVAAPGGGIRPAPGVVRRPLSVNDDE